MGLALIAACALFPPRRYAEFVSGTSFLSSRAFLLDRSVYLETGTLKTFGETLDSQRLFAEVVFLSAFTAAFVVGARLLSPASRER
jgi:hypothetical protein